MLSFVQFLFYVLGHLPMAQVPAVFAASRNAFQAQEGIFAKELRLFYGASRPSFTTQRASHELLNQSAEERARQYCELLRNLFNLETTS